MGRFSTILAGRSPPKGPPVSARFEYARMSADDFSKALHDIDLAPPAFARIFGVRIEVVTRWLKGEQDIPPWVFVVCWLLREIPNGIAIARTAAANHIARDHKY